MIRALSATLLLAGCIHSRPAIPDAPAPAVEDSYETVILNGRVMDPESGLDAVRNVGITGGVVRVITDQPIRGATRIDARGLVVAPGFIDLHQHAHTPEALRVKVLDGVTAAFEMELGVPDIDARYAEVEGNAPIHFGAAVGHPFLRMQVLTGATPGEDLPFGEGATRLATPDEIAAIRERIEHGLRRGALGVGLAIEYTPGAVPWEVLDVPRSSRLPGAPVHVHVRGTEAPRYWMETAELFLGAFVSGAPLHIVHANSSFGGDAPRLFGMIVAARAHGLDVTTETYPYTASMTSIRAAPFDDWEQWPDERKWGWDRYAGSSFFVGFSVSPSPEFETGHRREEGLEHFLTDEELDAARRLRDEVVERIPRPPDGYFEELERHFQRYPDGAAMVAALRSQFEPEPLPYRRHQSFGLRYWQTEDIAGWSRLILEVLPRATGEMGSW